MNCPINVKNCTPWKVIKNSVHQYESYHVNQQLRIEIHQSVDTIAHKWKQYEQQFSRFLHVSFFKAIESAKFKNLDFRYILVYENDQLSGLIPIQLTRFKAKNSIQQDFGSPWKNWVKNRLSFNAMIAGNILVSGPYMNAFLEKSTLEAQIMTEDVMNFYSQVLKEQENKNKSKNTNTLGKITKNLPSILKSQKIQEEVSKDGFDFVVPVQPMINLCFYCFYF